MQLIKNTDGTKTEHKTVAEAAETYIRNDGGDFKVRKADGGWELLIKPYASSQFALYPDVFSLADNQENATVELLEAYAKLALQADSNWTLLG